MGSWGVSAFDNDNASDWVWTLEEANDTTVLTDTLQAVVSQGEIVDGWEEALAAAEVVAALLGRPLPNLDDEVREFVERIGKNTNPNLVTLAVAAATKVLNTPSIKQGWKSGEVMNWQNAVADLLKRLGR